MTAPAIINGGEPQPVRVNETAVALLDGVLDLAIKGKVQSLAIVMVTSPGQFRIVAAGDDIDGLAVGAGKMQAELLKRIEQEAKTVLHKQ